GLQPGDSRGHVQLVAEALALAEQPDRAVIRAVGALDVNGHEVGDVQVCGMDDVETCHQADWVATRGLARISRPAGTRSVAAARISGAARTLGISGAARTGWCATARSA